MHWFHVNYIACKIDGYVRFVTAMRLGLPSHYCSHSIKSQSDYWLAKEYFGQLIARDNFGVTRLQSNQLFNFLSQFAAQTFEDVLKPCKVPRIVNATMTRTRLEGDSDKGTGNETDGPVEPYHQLPHGSRINVRSCVQWHTRRALQMAANWVSVSIILVCLRTDQVQGDWPLQNGGHWPVTVRRRIMGSGGAQLRAHHHPSQFLV